MKIFLIFSLYCTSSCENSAALCLSKVFPSFNARVAFLGPVLTTHKLAEIKGLSAQYFENRHCSGSVPVPRCAGQCAGCQNFPDFLQMLCETAHLRRARQKQTLRWWQVSGSSFPGPCFSCCALLGRLGDNFPEALEANNGQTRAIITALYGERENKPGFTACCV